MKTTQFIEEFSELQKTIKNFVEKYKVEPHESYLPWVNKGHYLNSGSRSHKGNFIHRIEFFVEEPLVDEAEKIIKFVKKSPELKEETIEWCKDYPELAKSVDDLIGQL